MKNESSESRFNICPGCGKSIDRFKVQRHLLLCPKPSKDTAAVARFIDYALPLRVAAGCGRILTERQLPLHLRSCPTCGIGRKGFALVHDSPRFREPHVRVVCSACGAKLTRRKLRSHTEKCPARTIANKEESSQRNPADAQFLSKVIDEFTNPPPERDYDEFNLTTPNTPVYRRRTRRK